MKVSEHRKCVIFLSQQRGDGAFVPRGTAFLVGEASSTDPEVLEKAHLITARHVVESARAAGLPLFARGTGLDGEGIATCELSFDRWHVSATTDVALYTNIRLDGFSQECIPLEAFADDDYLAKHEVGPGDEVFFAGLFVSFAGSAHHEPIVRFGNISMMPREPVPIKNADESLTHVKAFLVEARSWGGQSGSPAFVWLSPLRQPGVIQLPKIDPNKPLPWDAQPRLLGLVCGHFDIRHDIAFDADAAATGSVRLNSGIAIVIPAQDIASELRLSAQG